MKAWFAALWLKLKPGLIAAGVFVLGILALIGIAKVRQGGSVKPSGVKSPQGGAPGLPMPQGGTAAEEKAKEAAREKVLADDPSHVVDGLDGLARGRIDDAKRAGIQAGRDALHRSGGNGGG